MALNTTGMMRIFRNSGQNFKVDTIELRNPFNGQLLGTHILYRSDTKDVLKVGVSDAFEPLQNEKVLDVFRKLGEYGHLSVSSGGIFDSGKVTYTQFCVGRGASKKFCVGKDYIEKRFTLFHHHDGRAGVYILPTPFIYSDMAYLPGLNVTNEHYTAALFNIRHSRDMEEKLSSVTNYANDVFSAYEHIQNMFESMNSTPVSEKFAMEMILSEFPHQGVSAKKSTVSINALNNLILTLESVRDIYYNETDGEPALTKWTLFRAVHNVHQFHPLRASSSEENHQFSILNGNVRRNSQDFLDRLVYEKDVSQPDVTIADIISNLKRICE